MTIPPWPVCFGIETEIGISIADDPTADVVEESIRLVRSATHHGASRIWDYREEDPHLDARGFRVDELRQDTDEANFFSQDSQRPLSFEEIKSDLVLRNGARFYNDHAHPEFSTPECGTLADIVAQDKAGERILAECAKVMTEQTGKPVKLYKNNTDFRGHSYGCHDNYLISRDAPWDRLVEGMTPFLVTRQIFAGAGKVGWETEDKAISNRGGFQISQRADFFTELVGIDTMSRRPLINTRDEPHANPSKYRRFHIIIGDANLAGFATWLKIGTTALVLEALDKNAAPTDLALADPIASNMAISRDENFRWEVTLRSGKPSTAVEIQRGYADFVERTLPLDNPEQRAVLIAWRETLDALDTDPLSLRDRLDWPAKRWLLDTFRQSENLAWNDPWLQSLDLEYHLLDPEHGLFYALEATGQMRRQVDESKIIEAIQQPPRSSRAYIRGKGVQKFAPSLDAAQWDFLVVRHRDQLYRIDLRDAFGPDLDHLATAIDQSTTPADIIDHLQLRPL